MFHKLKAKINALDVFTLYSKKKKHFSTNQNLFINYIIGDHTERSKGLMVIDRVVDIFSNSDVLFNYATNEMYKKYLRQHLIDGYKKTNNDILDVSLFDVLHINKDSDSVDIVVTLDKKYAIFIRTTCNNQVVVKSTEDFKNYIFINKFL